MIVKILVISLILIIVVVITALIIKAVWTWHNVNSVLQAMKDDIDFNHLK